MTKPEKKALVPALRFPEFRDVGEWEEKPLGKISDVRDGTHDSPSFVSEGRPLVTSKNLLADGSLDIQNVSLISEDDYEQINKRSKVDIGDILFGMIGTIGNPILVKSDGYAIKNVALIKEKYELRNRYLVQLLNSQYIAKKFSILNTGNTQKFIALGKIRELEIPVPNLKEQQKIADCLSSIDDLITAQTQKLAALKAHKKGLMQQLFPAEGETVPELRFPEFRDGGEWESFTLFELVEVASGQVNPTEYPYCNMPHIGGENIESHTGSIKGVRAAKELGLISGKYLFDERDVLYSKIRPVLNKVGIPDFQGICSCRVPYDHIPLRSYPLFKARYILEAMLSAHGYPTERT